MEKWVSHIGDPHIPLIMVCLTDGPHTFGKTVSKTGVLIFTNFWENGDPGAAQSSEVVRGQMVIGFTVTVRVRARDREWIFSLS